MPALRYIGAIDEIDLPLIRASIKRGDTFDATDDQATVLLAQSSNYEPADDDAIALLAALNAADEPADEAVDLTKDA